MKNRVTFLMLAATTLLSSPVWAAPVVMLQFGSFETREEAEEKLNALKSKHAGVLSPMQSGIREVTLPPDNLTVYRTQAGPLPSRAAAQSICSQLASNGEDCYVVETAMAPSFSPAPAVAAAAVAPTTDKPMVASAAPAPAPMPPATVAPMPSALTNAPVNSGPAPMTSLSAVPARDPGNMAAINRVTAAPAPAAAPVAMASAPVSNEMQKAMDAAAAEQNKAEADVKNLAEAPTPPDAKKEGTFWSRLNPFSDDEAPANASPKPAPAPMPVAAPVAPVEEKPMPAPVMASAPAPTPAPAPVAMAAAPAAPMMAAPTPVAADAMLPPPPAPLVGRGAVADTTSASLRTPSMPAPVIVPQATGSMPQVAANTAPAPLVVPPPGTLQPANGNVRVGEAQRVPLSQATVPVAAPRVPAAPAAMLPGSPSVSLRPSATLGQKTLWAQVGSFNDAQTALSYWDNFRRTHPDFPVVRVRVSSSFAALQRGTTTVNLRVGPFLRDTSVRTLCATIAKDQDDRDVDSDLRVQCGGIVDTGIAASVAGPRNGYLNGSRYKR